MPFAPTYAFFRPTAEGNIVLDTLQAPALAVPSLLLLPPPSASGPSLGLVSPARGALPPSSAGRVVDETVADDAFALVASVVAAVPYQVPACAVVASSLVLACAVAASSVARPASLETDASWVVRSANSALAVALVAVASVAVALVAVASVVAFETEVALVGEAASERAVAVVPALVGELAFEAPAAAALPAFSADS